MNNDTFRNSVFRDAAQDARSAESETAQEVRRDSSTAQRSDAPEKRIYGDA